MKQKELIDLAAATMGVSKDQAQKALEGAFATLAKAIATGDGKVPVAGVGTFHVKQTKARKGRNPQSGAEIDIPSKKKLVFKPSGDIDGSLNPSAAT